EHPPAHTGMNEQSFHSSHAVILPNRFAEALRRSSCRPSRWPVGSGAWPANPGHAYSEPSGPIVWACVLWISHGPMCTPSTVLKPRLVVPSRRNALLSSRKCHESQAPLAVVTPAPADVMQVPLSGLPSPDTAVS